jgi:hypothetical protein
MEQSARVTALMPVAFPWNVTTMRLPSALSWLVAQTKLMLNTPGITSNDVGGSQFVASPEAGRAAPVAVTMAEL